MFIKERIILLGSCLIMIFSMSAQGLIDLRTFLDANIGSNKTIVLPTGQYLLDLSGNLQAYQFVNLSNLVIDGNGSSIICNRQTRAFDFVNCTNVMLKNVSIDYQPLCFTQGVITSISTDQRTWVVRLHNGYPITGITTNKVDVFDPTTKLLKKNYKTLFSGSFTVTSLIDRNIEIDLSSIPLYSDPVHVGEYVVLDVKGDGNIRPHTIFSSYCKNMVFDHVTVFGANSFSLFESDCDNSHYLSCVIDRKGNDSTVEVPRLRAGNADGIHSKNAVVGPTIDSCTIEFNGDDCIAINGRFYPIFKVDTVAKQIFLMSADTYSNIKVQLNDSIVCVGNSGVVKGIKAVSDIADALMSAAERQTCINQFQMGLNNVDTYIYGVRLTLGSWVNALSLGDLIYSKQRTGCNFAVKNNHIGNNRARGMVIKASNGIIDNNLVEGCAMAGIMIAPEFYWMEAGCSSGVIVSNNTIKNVLFSSTNKSLNQPGAISITMVNGDSSFGPSGVFNDISITGNYIEASPMPCIVLTSAKNLTLKGNVINTSNSPVRQHGINFGVSNANPVWTINMDGLLTDDIIPASKKLPTHFYLNVKSKTLQIFLNAGSISGLIYIYDGLGRMVLNNNISFAIGQCIVPLNQLKEGIYLFRLQVSGNSYSGKIIL